MGAANSNKFAQNVETALFGILVSLTIKAGIDGASSEQEWPRFDSIHVVLHCIWDSAFPQLMVFMLTVIRFTYGVYRVQEYVECLGERSSRIQSLLNFVASLALFMMFYVAGKHVERVRTFYAALCFVHAIDLVWFAVKSRVLQSSATLHPAAKRLRETAFAFVLIDAVTIGALVSILTWFEDPELKPLALVFMFLVGAADFILNRRFFFEKESSLNA